MNGFTYFWPGGSSLSCGPIFSTICWYIYIYMCISSWLFSGKLSNLHDIGNLIFKPVTWVMTSVRKTPNDHNLFSSLFSITLVVIFTSDERFFKHPVMNWQLEVHGKTYLKNIFNEQYCWPKFLCKRKKHINKNETTSKAATYCLLNDTGNVLTNFKKSKTK